MRSTMSTQATDASLDTDVLHSQLPVLVKFWAPWCASCRAMAPIVEQLADDYGGRLRVVSVNIEDNPQAPARFNVRAIPNLVLVKNGQVAEQIIGAVPKTRLAQAIDRVLGT